MKSFDLERRKRQIVPSTDRRKPAEPLREAAVNLAHNILAGERPAQITVEALAAVVLEMDAYIRALKEGA